VQIEVENKTCCHVRVSTKHTHGKHLLYTALFKETHNWYQFTTWLRVKPGVALTTDRGCSFYHRGRNNKGWFVLMAPTKKALEADTSSLTAEFC
jgi:hypothetical protein